VSGSTFFRKERRYMYSPKISEAFIPVLYRMAKDRNMKMTVLVNRIIEEEIQKTQKKEVRNERDINASEWKINNERSA
jgi:predicted DNA-binding ribbon-helix-helix protein